MAMAACCCWDATLHAPRRRPLTVRLKLRLRSMPIPIEAPHNLPAIVLRCHGSQAQGDASRAIPAWQVSDLPISCANWRILRAGNATAAPCTRLYRGRRCEKPQNWVDIAAYLNKTAPLHRAQTGDGTGSGAGQRDFPRTVRQLSSCRRSRQWGRFRTVAQKSALSLPCHSNA